MLFYLQSLIRNCHVLIAAELGLANLAMWYQSIVLLAFAAAVVYYEQSRPILLVSEIAGIVCLNCHFWCSHITEFWLPQSNGEDSSVAVLLCCFSLFVLAFFLGVNKRPIAGMSIICLATMCMIGCLAACIREYNRTRYSKIPLLSELNLLRLLISI